MTARSTPASASRGPEGVPECVRVAAGNTSRRPVIAKNRAQARRGQWLAAVRPFGHDEQLGSLGLRAFGQEVGLDDAGYVHIKWNTALFGAFAAHRAATVRRCRHREH